MTRPLLLLAAVVFTVAVAAFMYEALDVMRQVGT